MKRALVPLACLGLAVAVAPACDSGFPTVGAGHKLAVTVTSGNTSTLGKPLPVSTVTPTVFTIHVEALLPDGTIDTSFNGYVNVSAQPGTVSDLSVRNIKLTKGVVDNVAVPVVGAFGQAHIWVDDLGYEPAAPTRKPPPQCSDGVDNNGDGLIDYPADPGCYAPVDDTEDFGTYAAGVSGALYFDLPRVDLVRGYDPANNGNGNATAFPHEQIDIDTGWRQDTNYAFSTVVIGLSASGFFVQDLQSDLGPSAPGYAGLYAYNFSTPAFMRVCDRVQLLSGTASDFYGYTELNYPTWQLEYWNPAVRPCLVPEPTVVAPTDLNNDNRLWQLEATLVRTLTEGTVSAHVAGHFGPNYVPKINGTYTPDANSSNCDFNHNGKVDFTDVEETACATVCLDSCTAAPTDYECSEWSQFQSQTNFEIIVTDSASGARARVQASAAAANLFNPVTSRGQTIHSFTGLLAYFSGGCQFTLNARCQDDIVPDMNAEPMVSSVACVHPRTLSDINANSQ